MCADVSTRILVGDWVLAGLCNFKQLSRRGGTRMHFQRHDRPTTRDPHATHRQTRQARRSITTTTISQACFSLSRSSRSCFNLFSMAFNSPDSEMNGRNKDTQKQTKHKHEGWTGTIRQPTPPHNKPCHEQHPPSRRMVACTKTDGTYTPQTIRSKRFKRIWGRTIHNK